MYARSYVNEKFPFFFSLDEKEDENIRHSKSMAVKSSELPPHHSEVEFHLILFVFRSF